MSKDTGVPADAAFDDFQKKNCEKTFSDLDELENWIFNQMKQDYNKYGAMTFPTLKFYNKYGFSGPGRISFQPEYGDADIWIHKIESSQGIIFSDGTYTSGQKHWSRQVQEWLQHCDDRKRAPKFNFVE